VERVAPFAPPKSHPSACCVSALLGRGTRARSNTSTFSGITLTHARMDRATMLIAGCHGGVGFNEVSMSLTCWWHGLRVTEQAVQPHAGSKKCDAGSAAHRSEGDAHSAG
jgi:hypothetical protein